MSPATCFYWTRSECPCEQRSGLEVLQAGHLEAPVQTQTTYCPSHHHVPAKPSIWGPSVIHARTGGAVADCVEPFLRSFAAFWKDIFLETYAQTYGGFCFGNDVSFFVSFMQPCSSHEFANPSTRYYQLT